MKRIRNLSTYLIAFTMSLYFFYSILQLSLFNVASRYLMENLQLDGTQLGLLSSSYLYALAFTLLPAGYLLDRYSTRTITLITMGLSVCSALLFALFHHLWILGLYRVIAGMANGFAFLASLRIVAYYFPKRIALASGLIIAIGMSGGLFASIPFVQIVTYLGWPVGLLFNAGLGVVFWLILLLFIQDHPEEHRDVVSQLSIIRFKQVMVNRQNWLCGFYPGLLNLSVYLLGALWGNLYLTQRYGLSHTHASLVSAMIFLGIMIGSPLWGWFSDVIVRRKLPLFLGASASLSVILVIMFFSAHSAPFFVLLFLVLGLVNSAQVISFSIIAESNARTLISTATGFATLLFNLVGASLQPVFGWLLTLHWDGQIAENIPVYSVYDHQLAMLVLPIAFLVAFIIAFFIRETRCQSFSI